LKLSGPVDLLVGIRGVLWAIEVKDIAGAEEARGNGKVPLIAGKEYYDFPAVAAWIEQHGIKQTPEGTIIDF